MINRIPKFKIITSYFYSLILPIICYNLIDINDIVYSNVTHYNLKPIIVHGN